MVKKQECKSAGGLRVLERCKSREENICTSRVSQEPDDENEMSRVGLLKYVEERTGVLE